MKGINMKKYVFISLLFFSAITVLVGCGKQKQNENTSAGASAQQSDEEYYCPMHPEVRSRVPGVCPICHMTLVKKQVRGESLPGTIELTAANEIVANIKTMKTQLQPIDKVISGYSVIDFAEDARKTISAKFNGRVEKLFPSVSGTLVKKGTPLFSAYSADIYQTMGEYSAARQRGGDAVVRIADAARLKLQLAGFDESQLHELDAKKEASPVFIFHSPFDGTIVEKKIQEGSYFSEGTALYELVDISRLWNIVEVAEADAAQLQQGMTGELSVSGTSGKVYPVRLTLFYPAVNKQNRTVKIRTELLRGDKALRAQMYGETKFHIKLGQGVLVPEDAILFTGKRQLVYVRTGEMKFVAREIQVGSRIGENYVVTAGLAAGEEIAISGGYLLDSESQLRYGGAAPAQHSENVATTPVQNSQSVGRQLQQKAVVPGDNKQQANAMNRNEAKPMSHESKAATYIDKNDPMYKKMGIFNAVCPVLGEEISGNHPTVLYKGKIYGFCCRGCDKKFLADPEKYTRNLSPDGKTFIGQK